MSWLDDEAGIQLADDDWDPDGAEEYVDLLDSWFREDPPKEDPVCAVCGKKLNIRYCRSLKSYNLRDVKGCRKHTAEEIWEGWWVTRIIEALQVIPSSRFLGERAKQMREGLLVELARSGMRRAYLSRERVHLPYLNSYERRLIHLELEHYPGLHTESVGEDRINRHVTVWCDRDTPVEYRIVRHIT